MDIRLIGTVGELDRATDLIKEYYNILSESELYPSRDKYNQTENKRYRKYLSVGAERRWRPIDVFDTDYENELIKEQIAREAYEDGKAEIKYEAALNLLKKGLSLIDICEATELTEEEVRKIVLDNGILGS